MALGLFALAVQAQVEKRQLSPAESLSCLTKPEEVPQYPKFSSRTAGVMRVLLEFRQPDAEPEIKVLVNTASEDMQIAARRYLRRYRLPCLTARDGVVTAVQEFSFSKWDRGPVPFPRDMQDESLPSCFVTPPRDMDAPDRKARRGRRAEHIVAMAEFKGDGTQPPVVTFRYSSGVFDFEYEVRNYMARYRMPCRKADDKPQTIEQVFLWDTAEDKSTTYRLRRHDFTLQQFLNATKEPGKLEAHYDFDSMDCPFKVIYTLYDGNLPNEAVVRGPRNPNRSLFLDWLASQQLRFTADQLSDLFGTNLEIAVPCGSLDLNGGS